MHLEPTTLTILVLGFLIAKEIPTVWRIGRALRRNAGGRNYA